MSDITTIVPEAEMSAGLAYRQNRLQEIQRRRHHRKSARQEARLRADNLLSRLKLVQDSYENLDLAYAELYASHLIVRSRAKLWSVLAATASAFAILGFLI